MRRWLGLALIVCICAACGGRGLTVATAQGNCGEIRLAGNPPLPTDAQAARQATACFVQAFQACTPATLTIHETDDKVRQFAVIAGSPCTLRQALQTDPNVAPAVADCANVRVNNGGLVVEGCSHLGDFILTWTKP